MVFGGAVALGVRNAVVDGMGGGAASAVEEAARPDGAVVAGAAGRTAGVPADTPMPPSPDGEEAALAPAAAAPVPAAAESRTGTPDVAGGTAAPAPTAQNTGGGGATDVEESSVAQSRRNGHSTSRLMGRSARSAPSSCRPRRIRFCGAG